MKLKDRIILITSNEPWGDIWYSKQNYAYELSKNNLVFFINPPTRWKFSNLFRNKIKQAKYTDSLIYLDYENYLPIRGKFLNVLNNKLVSRKLKKYFFQKGKSPDILWAFDPLRLYDYKLLGAKMGIYHVVDYYYFKYYGEVELCKKSDLIFSTSQKFLDEFSAFNTPKYIVPHGISSEEFHLSPQELQNLDVPVEGYGLYVGVIDHRMDFDLLEKVIKKFPEQSFVFVGPLRLPEKESAKRIFEKKRYANVYILGPKHFKTLKYYIKKAKFCISFMDMEYHANIVHHHKTLVYLTQGKPVFGPVFTEYIHLGEILYMDNTHEGIIKILSNFIDNGEAENLSEKRINYARKYTFENVLKDAGEIIEQQKD